MIVFVFHVFCFTAKFQMVILWQKKLYSEPLTGFSKNAHKQLANHQNKSGSQLFTKNYPNL